ncbi:hypothetical protein SSPO_001170 [Streptomyces antimycoticus]|uniref:Uncharacterized protein n=1 Tax=Streptomyces antimycoticus TaxID=68175 RepID=A0A499UK05_9ACTN|nr:hypothetical protein [Streptomyces antimycoticus]BBJ37399.1 hypothetical protein SSPO_001170 [Streptomyces antimycoticus]
MPTASPDRVIYVLTDTDHSETAYLGYIVPPRSRPLEEAILYGRLPVAVDHWWEDAGEVGHRLEATVLREGVPAGSVRRALREEKARYRALGMRLLNDRPSPRQIARNRLNQLWAEAAWTKARTHAWAQMAQALRDQLGGPLDPPVGSVVVLSDAAWTRIEQLPHPAFEYSTALSNEMRAEAIGAEAEAERAGFAVAKELIDELVAFWPDLTHSCGEDTTRKVMVPVSRQIVRRRRTDRDYLGKLLGLLPWCVTAVVPWYQMAKNGKLVSDMPEFITWLNGHPAARALESIADEGDLLDYLLSNSGLPDLAEPSVALMTIAAAHCSVEVPQALRGDVEGVLRQLISEPALTQPMVDLLMRLAPYALAYLGPDIAPGMDKELSLPEGTTARVLSALVTHPEVRASDRLRRLAWSSAKHVPTVAIPNCSPWGGVSGGSCAPCRCC